MSQENRSWADVLKGAAKWVANEAIMPAAEKLIPQGAAELTQALHMGNGYVPYGPTERPVPMDSQEAAAPTETAHGTSYQSHLEMYAARAPHGMEQQQDNHLDR